MRFSKDFNKNIFLQIQKPIFILFFSKDIKTIDEYFIRVTQEWPCMQIKRTVGIDGSNIH